jgi:hypothetical protein
MILHVAVLSVVFVVTELFKVSGNEGMADSSFRGVLIV